MDDFKEQKELSDRKQHEQRVKDDTSLNATGSVLLQVSASLDAQKDLCVEMVHHFGNFGLNNTSALKDITKQLGDNWRRNEMPSCPYDA